MQNNHSLANISFYIPRQNYITKNLCPVPIDYEFLKMDCVFKIFSNREIALFIWGLVLLIIILSEIKYRHPFINVIKAAFAPKLFLLNISFAVYVTALVVLLWKFNFWDISHLKDTIVWFLFSALGIAYGLHKVRNARYFVELIKSTLSVTIAIQFIVNLHSFPLWLELILLPLTSLLIIISAYAEHSSTSNKEHEKVDSCLKSILTVVGLFYIGYALYKTIADYRFIFTWDTAKQFLLPIILMFLALPYFYILALYMKFESLFATSNVLFRDIRKTERFKIKLYILIYTNFSFNRIFRVWKEIGFLPYEKNVNYRKYIKELASAPAYKKAKITPKMNIELFNDIDACCKALSTLNLGEFSEWNELHGFNEYYCSPSYYKIKPNGLSNLLLSLHGEERYIHRLEFTLNINSQSEREECLIKFEECAEKIFSLLSLKASLGIFTSLMKNEHNGYDINKCTIDLSHEINGQVESFVIIIKSNS